MKSKSIIILFTLSVVILNIAAIMFFDFKTFSIVKMVSSLLYLIVFLNYCRKYRVLIVFTSLLFISDVIEMQTFVPQDLDVYAGFRFVALSLLCFTLFRKLKQIKLEKKISIFLIVVFIINLLIAFKVVNTVPELLKDSVRSLVVLLYWTVSVLSAGLAAKYFFYIDTKKALYFVVFTFFFVFTDLFGFIYVFYKVQHFLFLDVIFYFLGFMYLSFYLFSSEELKLEQK